MTEKTLRVSLKREVDDSYEIVFGSNLFPEIARYLKNNDSRKNYAIITDSNVRDIHATRLRGAMIKEGLANTTIFAFPAGENNKTLDRCTEIMDRMSGCDYGRDSYILALGGGVVGDMAGFMAAIFNRGVPYIQIPTTLLAQADSSVGGKTGVDTHYGKNLIGAFKQPKRVFVDVATLDTLSGNEFRHGLAETIKHGVIRDASFFAYLEKNMKHILAREEESLLEIARQNCKIKGKVVEIDPEEKGLRRILNYGHTIGHAVEKLSKFDLSHGSCVSIGMMAAGRVALEIGQFNKQDFERQQELLIRIGLPLHIPQYISNEEIIALTTLDKKAKGGEARYCLPIKIGQMNEFSGAYAKSIPKEFVINALNKTRWQKE